MSTLNEYQREYKARTGVLWTCSSCDAATEPFEDFGMCEDCVFPKATCSRCGDKIEGAVFNGRCYSCHNETLMPYESGEDYIGWSKL